MCPEYFSQEAVREAYLQGQQEKQDEFAQRFKDLEESLIGRFKHEKMITQVLLEVGDHAPNELATLIRDLGGRWQPKVKIETAYDSIVLSYPQVLAYLQAFEKFDQPFALILFDYIFSFENPEKLIEEKRKSEILLGGFAETRF